VSTLEGLIGTELGPSRWIEIDQERIERFATATDDHQWIHVDPVRATAGPFGSTIAHGFLTLSLVVPMLGEVLPRDESTAMAVNYGVDRVRFPAPVAVGSRVRGRFTVTAVEPGARGERISIAAVVERDGGDAPVCVAELVVLRVPRA
jgi:acyl dehydratase